jgi:hypothetical protein
MAVLAAVIITFSAYRLVGRIRWKLNDDRQAWRIRWKLNDDRQAWLFGFGAAPTA